MTLAFDFEDGTDGEVSDPSTEVASESSSSVLKTQIVESEEDSHASSESSSSVLKTKIVESEEDSHASSEVIESEAGDDEVQSSKAYPKGSLSF